MVIWREGRTAFEFLAVPAIGTFVVTAHGDGIAAFCKDFSHAPFVPTRGRGAGGEASEGHAMSTRATAALLTILAFGCMIPAAAATDGSTLDQAQRLVDKHDFKGAITLLDHLLAGDPKNAKALVLRGDAKDENGDPTGALADYNTALTINPDYAYGYATRCDTQNELDHYDDAVSDCTRALSLDSGSQLALRARSEAYYFLGDYDKALQDAQNVVTLDPTDSRALLTRCRAYFGAGRFEDARKDCTSVLTYDPDTENAYFYRGRSAYAQNDFPAAIADLQKIVNLDGDFPGAHYWLAAAEYGAGRYNSALSEVDAYMLKYPHDADALLMRARVNQRLGKTSDAKADAQQALRAYRIDNDDDGVKAAQALIDALAP